MSSFKISYSIQIPSTTNIQTAKDNSASMHDSNTPAKVIQLESAFDTALSLTPGTANLLNDEIDTTTREELVKIPKVVEMLFNSNSGGQNIYDIQTAGKFAKLYYIIKYSGDTNGALDDNSNWSVVTDPANVTISSGFITQVKIADTEFPGSGTYTIHIALERLRTGTQDYNEYSQDYTFTV